MPKKPDLASVLSDLRTKHKQNIGSLDDFQMIPKGLTTGNLILDALTGVGGFPRGRYTELFGKPSSGKTTAALQAAAFCQAYGGKVAFFDYERGLDMIYCQALGVDTDELIYTQPDSFEEGAFAFRRLVETGQIDMAIFDSVATMVTENELNAETGQAKVADRAKMMHQFLRQTVGLVHNTDTCAIFLNHVMDLVDASPMGQKLSAQGIKRQTTPGGTALPFYSSLRIEFKQVGNIRSKHESLISGQVEDQIRSTKVQATVVKNKVADPFGTAELRIRYGRGFSNEYSVYRILADVLAIKSDQVGKHTFHEDCAFTPEERSEFTIPTGLRGLDWIRGEDNVLRCLESSPSWYARCRDLAKQLLDDRGVATVSSDLYGSNGEDLSAELEEMGS